MQRGWKRSKLSAQHKQYLTKTDRWLLAPWLCRGPCQSSCRWKMGSSSAPWHHDWKKTDACLRVQGVLCKKRPGGPPCSNEEANSYTGVARGTSTQTAFERSNTTTLALPHATSEPPALEAGETPVWSLAWLHLKSLREERFGLCFGSTPFPFKRTHQTFL